MWSSSAGSAGECGQRIYQLSDHFPTTCTTCDRGAMTEHCIQVPASAIQPNKMYSDDKMTSVKPPYSYLVLISMSIQDSPDKRLTLNGIYDYITTHFSYYRNRENQGWRNSIRNTLTKQECFMKLPEYGKYGKRLSHYWVLDPHHEVLFEKGNYLRRLARRLA